MFAYLYRATSVSDVDAETETNLELRKGNHITQNMASPCVSLKRYLSFVVTSHCYVGENVFIMQMHAHNLDQSHVFVLYCFSQLVCSMSI